MKKLILSFFFCVLLAVIDSKPLTEQAELPHSREFYAGYIKAITDNFDQLFETDRETRSTKEEDENKNAKADEKAPSKEEPKEKSSGEKAAETLEKNKEDEKVEQKVSLSKDNKKKAQKRDLVNEQYDVGDSPKKDTIPSLNFDEITDESLDEMRNIDASKRNLIQHVSKNFLANEGSGSGDNEGEADKEGSADEEPEVEGSGGEEAEKTMQEKLNGQKEKLDDDKNSHNDEVAASTPEQKDNAKEVRMEKGSEKSKNRIVTTMTNKNTRKRKPSKPTPEIEKTEHSSRRSEEEPGFVDDGNDIRESAEDMRRTSLDQNPDDFAKLSHSTLTFLPTNVRNYKATPYITKLFHYNPQPIPYGDFPHEPSIQQNVSPFARQFPLHNHAYEHNFFQRQHFPPRFSFALPFQSAYMMPFQQRGLVMPVQAVVRNQIAKKDADANANTNTNNNNCCCNNNNNNNGNGGNSGNNNCCCCQPCCCQQCCCQPCCCCHHCCCQPMIHQITHHHHTMHDYTHHHHHHQQQHHEHKIHPHHEYDHQCHTHCHEHPVEINKIHHHKPTHIHVCDHHCCNDCCHHDDCCHDNGYQYHWG